MKIPAGKSVKSVNYINIINIGKSVNYINYINIIYNYIYTVYYSNHQPPNWACDAGAS